MWGCLSPLQQEPPAKAFGESQGGCSGPGINFKRAQGSARGCQAVICGWLCFLSSSCCSLSGNAKESERQAAVENVSLYLFRLFWVFFFCKENTSPAELAVAANQSLQGPLAGLQGLPNRDSSRAPLMQSTELGEVTWKEFVCCRQDKIEHQNQPWCWPSPTGRQGRQLQSESCEQQSRSLGCSLPGSSCSLSPLRAHASQKMGLKTKFRLGKACFSLSCSQVTQLCVTAGKP